MSYYNFDTEHDYAIYWMGRALKLARKAALLGEVPVGALIVQNGVLVSSSYNQKESKLLSTAHAELLAIQKACKKLNNWRLTQTHMFVTMEPCLMCAGGLIQARISKLYFGCFDPKGGALLSRWHVHQSQGLNHKFKVEGGILEEECLLLLKEFFRKKRLQHKIDKNK